MAERLIVWISWACILLMCFQVILAKNLMPVISHPRQFKEVDMPYIPPAEIDKAFNRANLNARKRSSIEKQLLSTNGIVPNDDSAYARHQMNNKVRQESMDMDKDQVTFEGASKYLVERYGLSEDQARYGLTQVSLSENGQAASAIQQCKSRSDVGNCHDNKFRTADGSCNNLDKPSTGKSFGCFERLAPPAYLDGLSIPRRSITGNELPNPRTISYNMHEDVFRNSQSFTHFVMQWGQFMDHDLTLTPMTRAGAGMDMIQCCGNTGQSHPECFPIRIPDDDPFFSQLGETCMNFVRSSTCSEFCELGPRQQTNQLTHWVDGSQVYGSTNNETRALRTFQNGKLRSQFTQFGELLPPSSDPNNDQCSIPRERAICFQAGDGRVNEQPGLTVLHTLWVRQHNRIATEFQRMYPRANDEQIFQETRRLLGAQIAMITYNEFLPVVLGQDYMQHFNLYTLDRGYTKYDKKTDGGILNEFATAAYRFGHTLIQNNFQLFSNNGNRQSLSLRDNYFFPFGLFEGSLDPVLQGLFRQPAQRFDRHLVEAVTDHLYKPRGALFGMDLAALNIQRGRDHGLADYTHYLYYFFNIKIDRFSDLSVVMTKENWQFLQRLYKSPNDIDLFTGGVSETPLEGGVVGPTFGSIIGLQFYHLKFGDRYYFEHGGQSGSFSPDQLQAIRQTTLASVICPNSDGIIEIQGNVFEASNNYNQVYSCFNLRDIDLRPWK